MINAIKVNPKIWTLVAVDEANNKPRLIFPQGHLELESCSRFLKKVSLTINAIEKIVVTVQFSDTDGAKRFYNFVKDPPLN